MSPLDYNTFISSAYADGYLAGPDRWEAIAVSGPPQRIASPGSLPIVVVVACSPDGQGPQEADVVVAPDDVPSIVER
ncbi:MAG TPA: hypothetical protein VMM60_04630, partial [Ilumatobacter sp.]|nr:hypothetical protein [Ilumatobacter sp.]